MNKAAGWLYFTGEKTEPAVIPSLNYSGSYILFIYRASGDATFYVAGHAYNSVLTTYTNGYDGLTYSVIRVDGYYPNATQVTVTVAATSNYDEYTHELGKTNYLSSWCAADSKVYEGGSCDSVRYFQKYFVSWSRQINGGIYDCYQNRSSGIWQCKTLRT